MSERHHLFIQGGEDQGAAYSGTLSFDPTQVTASQAVSLAAAAAARNQFNFGTTNNAPPTPQNIVPPGAPPATNSLLVGTGTYPMQVVEDTETEAVGRGYVILPASTNPASFVALTGIPATVPAIATSPYWLVQFGDFQATGSTTPAGASYLNYGDYTENDTQGSGAGSFQWGTIGVVSLGMILAATQSSSTAGQYGYYNKISYQNNAVPASPFSPFQNLLNTAGFGNAPWTAAISGGATAANPNAPGSTTLSNGFGDIIYCGPQPTAVPATLLDTVIVEYDLNVRITIPLTTNAPNIFIKHGVILFTNSGGDSTHTWASEDRVILPLMWGANYVWATELCQRFSGRARISMTDLTTVLFSGSTRKTDITFPAFSVAIGVGTLNYLSGPPVAKAVTSDYTVILESGTVLCTLA